MTNFGIMLSANGIDQLRTLLRSLQVSGYLFGSFVRDELPNDFDILVVYPKAAPVNDILALRSRLRAFAEEELGMAAHVVLLTQEEESEVEFVTRENCLPIDLAPVKRVG